MTERGRRRSFVPRNNTIVGTTQLVSDAMFDQTAFPSNGTFESRWNEVTDLWLVVDWSREEVSKEARYMATISTLAWQISAATAPPLRVLAVKPEGLAEDAPVLLFLHGPAKRDRHPRRW